MEQVDGSPFNQQEYIQMIEKQKQLLYKEKNKNEESYLTLETLIHRSSKIVLAQQLPVSIITSPMPVSQWTCLPPPVAATQVLSQPCSLTTPMPMFYPCMHEFSRCHKHAALNKSTLATSTTTINRVLYRH